MSSTSASGAASPSTNANGSRRTDDKDVDTPCAKRGRTTEYNCCDVPSCGMVTPSASQVESELSMTASNSRSTKPASSSETKSLSREEIQALLKSEANYDIHSSDAVRKRSDYISWDEYFMCAALLSSQRSKDPTLPSGCCIVDSQNKIIGIGYNGFPSGCSDDCLPWTSAKDKHDNGKAVDWLHTAAPYAVHACVNAILNKGSADVVGGRLYTPNFPCHECAKVISQAGIKEVVFLRDTSPASDTSRASRILLQLAGVSLRKYQVERGEVVLNFTSSMPGDGEAVDKQPAMTDTAHQQSLFEKHRAILLEEANYDPSTSKSLKHQDCLSWDDYFMAMAFLTAQRSKDPNTQVGACLVDANRRIVGLGYNGFPAGASDDILPWSRTGDNVLHKKYHYVCHAEVNAVLNKCSNDVKRATLYVALFPCHECAKILVQAGVREVVYMNDIYRDTDSCRASRVLFKMAGVELRQYLPSIPSVTLPLQGDE